MVLQTSTWKIREGSNQASIQSIHTEMKEIQMNDNWIYMYNKANDKLI